MAASDEKTVKHGKTVLSEKFSAGPLGLGDPDDRSIRKAEEYTFVRQVMEKKAKEEKCADEVSGFFDCAGAAGGFKMLFSCRSEKNLMNNCLAKWYQDEQFKQECREAYLRERSEYRRTGISEKQRKSKRKFTISIY